MSGSRVNYLIRFLTICGLVPIFETNIFSEAKEYLKFEMINIKR